MSKLSFTGESRDSMSNQINAKQNQNEFTDEIERIFTKSSSAVNVKHAKITINRGSANGYGEIVIKGSSKLNVSALNMKLRNHYVANITFLDQDHAKLQIAPD